MTWKKLFKKTIDSLRWRKNLCVRTLGGAAWGTNCARWNPF